MPDNKNAGRILVVLLPFAAASGLSGCCSLHIGPSYYNSSEPGALMAVPGITEIAGDSGDKKPAPEDSKPGFFAKNKPAQVES